MELPLTTPTAKPREDILVSVCFSELPADPEAFSALQSLAKRLDQRFRFREIILVLDEQGHAAYLPLLQKVTDLRLFVIRPGNNYYDMRVIAAQEAIGDVVLIANYDEMKHIDVLEMIEQTSQKNTITLATRTVRHKVNGSLFAPIAALGKAAGFNVDVNGLQTIALPRLHLNEILSHSNPELALRFPPNDQRLAVSSFEVKSDIPFKHGLHQLKRRFHLLDKLLVHLAPFLLLLVTLSSMVLTFAGLGYAIYILGAWILIDELAAGWLSTSTMMSVSATFLGISILGLSLGMQQLLNHHNKNNIDNVAHEINRIDVFGKVASDLNVELGQNSSRTEKDNI